MRDKRSFWNVKFMDHSANTNGFFTCQIYIYLSGLWMWQGQNIRPMILKPRQAWESASGTVKIQIGGPYLQNFWFSRSRVSLRICISLKSPGNADDVGAGTTLCEAQEAISSSPAIREIEGFLVFGISITSLLPLKLTWIRRLDGGPQLVWTIWIIAVLAVPLSIYFLWGLWK